MRLVVQRVKSASVTVRGDQGGPPEGGGGGGYRRISSIGPGVLALVGLRVDDDASDLAYCARRLLNVRLWESSGDAPKPWKRHVRHMGYELLCVSQFTLYGTLSKKDQPDYKLAMKSDEARIMYDEFLKMLSDGYYVRGGGRAGGEGEGEGGKGKVFDGAFGQMMDVESVNDGPVTLVIDSREDGRRRLVPAAAGEGGGDGGGAMPSAGGGGGG
jgi:D-tyrosyl-tRNA(Tyr) deacylase